LDLLAKHFHIKQSVSPFYLLKNSASNKTNLLHCFSIFWILYILVSTCRSCIILLEEACLVLKTLLSWSIEYCVSDQFQRRSLNTSTISAKIFRSGRSPQINWTYYSQIDSNNKQKQKPRTHGEPVPQDTESCAGWMNSSMCMPHFEPQLRDPKNTTLWVYCHHTKVLQASSSRREMDKAQTVQDGVFLSLDVAFPVHFDWELQIWGMGWQRPFRGLSLSTITCVHSVCGVDSLTLSFSRDCRVLSVFHMWCSWWLPSSEQVFTTNTLDGLIIKVLIFIQHLMIEDMS
jgi:hypothetical protein